MNREIKFKAWDGKLMSKPFLLDDASYEGFPQPVVDENGDCRTVPITWLQWTGLKDNNGKEIYDGDIVLFPDTYTETVDVGIGNVPVAQTQENSFYPIEFRDGEFGMDVTGDTEVVYKGWQSLRELKDSVEYLEVIGNRFENPELLENI